MQDTDDDHQYDTGNDRRISVEARDWIVHLTSGDIGEAELVRFKLWRDLSPQHRFAFDQERAFWRQLHGPDCLPYEAGPLLSGKGMGRRAFLGASVAAASLLVAPYVKLGPNGDFSTGIGEQAQFTLTDGSSTVLNTESAIALDFRHNQRLANLLRGEVAFQAESDDSRPFRVAALGGFIETPGASFCVRAIDGQATVTVSKGCVRVISSSGPQSGVDLGENQQSGYTPGSTPRTASAADSEMLLAWRQGRVIFEAVPFAAAVAEIGRYVPERIVMTSAVRRNTPVSAVFSTRMALTAVHALARTQNLSARRIPGLVIVIS